MAKLSRLVVDSRTESEGRWLNYLEDVEVRIARWTQPELLAWYRAETQPLVEEYGEEIPDGALTPISKAAVARFIIRGIRNLDLEGQSFNSEVERNAWLLDLPGFGDEFFIWCIEQSRNIANFRGKYEEDAEGNSGRP